MKTLLRWKHVCLIALLALAGGLLAFADDKKPEDKEEQAAEAEKLQKQVMDSLKAYFEGDKDELSKMEKGLDVYLKQGRLDLQKLRVAHTVAMVLEMKGEYTKSLDLRAKTKELFAKSENKEYAKTAAELYDDAKKKLDVIGKKLDIEGFIANGEPFDPKKYEGKIVLLDFWATWCGPCRAELPNVKANFAKYNKQGFEVIGVSLDDDKKALDAFVEEQGIKWDNLFGKTDDTRGWKHPLAQKLNVNAIPATYLIGRDGKVRYINVRGEALGEVLAAMFEETEKKVPVEAEDKKPDSEEDSR